MFQPLQRGMRPLSVLRTSLPSSFGTAISSTFPIKGQEAVVAWKFSLGLSALAFPAPSRGRMPARQEGVFTKRLSDKQCIMKAASLLEHKGVFLVFVSPDANIFVYSVFNINLCVFAALRSKNKIFYSLSQFSWKLRLRKGHFLWIYVKIPVFFKKNWRFFETVPQNRTVFSYICIRNK